jgi:RHS repeat-associated protein
LRYATTHTTSPLNAFSAYRFHFNGKETDNEVYGEGNVYDYGFRIYNPRLGKFLSVDPLTKSFPFYSPYHFSGNKPIACIDIDGLEDIYYLEPFLKDGSTTVQKIFDNSEVGKDIYNKFQKLTISNPTDVVILEIPQNLGVGGATIYIPAHMIKKMANGDVEAINLFKTQLKKHTGSNDISKLESIIKEVAAKERALFIIAMQEGTISKGDKSFLDAEIGAFNLAHEWELHVNDVLDPTVKQIKTDNSVHADYYNEPSLKDMPKEMQPSIAFGEIKEDSRAGQTKKSIQESSRLLQKKK